MKSLQLRERRQIAESRKYCLVRVIIFLRGRRQIAESRKYCLVHVIIFLCHVFSLIFCLAQV